MKYEHDPEFSSGYSVPASSSKPRRKTVEMSRPAKLCCPICSNHFDRSQTTAMPFCSARCRQIDLGRWLNESYSMPHEGEGAPENWESADDESED
jgi:endogenous inhibitor of DNA gyrase (YacG/DUF329 family)